LWSSALSSAVSADLRAAVPTSLPVSASAVSSKAPAEELVESAKPALTKPAPLAAPVNNTAAEPVVQEPKAPAPKAKGRVAANFGSFLAKQAATSTQSASSHQKVVMGGSSRPPSSASQASASDPLAAAQPRVVAARPLDPVAEKREMTQLSQRLRVRAGYSGSRQADTSLDLRPRSSSFESDDEDSLAKISSALSNLEKSQAALKQREEVVAEEGHHSLQKRLDMTGMGPQEPLRVAATPSAAQAAAAAARAPVPVRPPRAANEPAESGPDLENLETAIAAAGREGYEESTPTASAKTFVLRVQLANFQSAALEFTKAEDIPNLVAAMVAKYHMRDVCEGPLIDRARQLLSSGQTEDSVDIIDLV